MNRLSDNLYTSEGWLSWPALWPYFKQFPFCWMLGARGIGKTYGVLNYCREHEIKLLILRNSGSQIEMLRTAELMPYNQINIDSGCKIAPRKISKYITEFIDDPEAEAPQTVAYATALSTFSNLRGISLQVDAILFDEFCPERSERKVRYAPETLMNMYESINRNREIKGGDPLPLICCSNAMDIANDYFAYLGLIEAAQKMAMTSQSVWKSKARRTIIIMPQNSPISAAKKETALYQMAGNSAFSKMAIDNDFAYNDASFIAIRPLSEYTPVITYEGIQIWRHKTRREWYITSSGPAQVAPYKWAVNMQYLRNHYWAGNIRFDGYASAEWFVKSMRLRE